MCLPMHCIGSLTHLRRSEPRKVERPLNATSYWHMAFSLRRARPVDQLQQQIRVTRLRG